MKALSSYLAVSYARWIHLFPKPVQLFIHMTDVRVRDGEAETLFQQSQDTTLAWPLLLRNFCLLFWVYAALLGVVSYSFGSALQGQAGLEKFFFPALFLMFFVAALRLLQPCTGRYERVFLLCLLGMSCYALKVMASPWYFAFFDEFLHWNTVNTMVQTGHLFRQNAMLPVSPYYPGLEIVTDAFCTISGLSTFTSGLVVVGFARLLLVLSLFLLNEQIFGSQRVASLATLLYMANPHFLMFDAQYGYESLALSLMVFLLWILEPHQHMALNLALLRAERYRLFLPTAIAQRTKIGRYLRQMCLMALLVGSAMAFTHHATDFFFDAFLLIWWIMFLLLRSGNPWRSVLWFSLLGALMFSLLSTFRPANPVISYLTEFIGSALRELLSLVQGSGEGRPLFVSYAGRTTPFWQRFFSFSSVLLICFGFPFGLLCLLKHYAKSALIRTFCLLALLYPLSQVFRFTNTGSELTDRAAAFLFIPIASLLAVFIVQFWPANQLRWLSMTALAMLMAICVLGGVVLGVGQSLELLPGPYMTIADARSIEPQGIQTAMWTRTHLHPGNRVASDRINQILLGSYGEQRIVNTLTDHVDISPLFLSPQFGPNEQWLLKQAHLRYLVVDMRLSRSRPLLGFYYEQIEPDAFHHRMPIERRALTKFLTMPQVNTVFDGGDLVIYDMEGLSHAS